jgi:AcrR family transcriptional regulator
MSMKQKMRELKRELMLEEAGRLFNRDGYENMKVAELAENIGVSVGSIYTMFGSKENLYNNYIISQIEHHFGLIRQEMEKYDDPVTRLRELVKIKFSAMIKNRNALRESIVNDPTFFLNMGDEEDALMELFSYIAANVMTPLQEQLQCSKPPMEMLFLFDGLTIGVIKYWMITDGNLMDKTDEVVDNFLLLLKGPS